MLKRPALIVLCASLFALFPAEYAYRLHHGAPWTGPEILASFILPALLVFGLIRVTALGWYTLVAFIGIWGVQDLLGVYGTDNASVVKILLHLLVYAISLAYFIQPRIRRLYFDPNLRWWRTKPRFETHMPLLLRVPGRANVQWQYPILRNVSFGGCFVETPHLLPMHEKVEVAIPLPQPLGVSVIKTEGTVRWISKNPLRFGYGIQFSTQERQHLRAIRKYVALRL